MYLVTASVGNQSLGLVGKYKCHLAVVERQITDWLLDWPNGQCIVYEADDESAASSLIAVWSHADH